MTLEVYPKIGEPVRFENDEIISANRLASMMGMVNISVIAAANEVNLRGESIARGEAKRPKKPRIQKGSNSLRGYRAGDFPALLEGLVKRTQRSHVNKSFYSWVHKAEITEESILVRIPKPEAVIVFHKNS